MTEVQKNNEWTGLYIDDENKEWEWTCEKKEPKPEDTEETVIIIKEKNFVPRSLFLNDEE